MKFIIKIALFPIRLILGLTIAFLTFVLSISTMLLSTVSFIIFIIGLFSLLWGEHDFIIQTMILAFLFSPYGLPRLGIYFITLLGKINSMIKSL